MGEGAWLTHLIFVYYKTVDEIIFNSLPEDDPKVRQPDITKAKNILNWLPVIQREEGLIKTMHYFKKAMSIT